MEHLTETQIQALSDRLKKEQKELVGQLAALEKQTQPVSTEEESGRIARADAMQQQQMALAHKQRLQLRLNNIRTALDQVGEGDYGLCLECGDAIAFERLNIKPDSTVCVSCREEQEKLR